MKYIGKKLRDWFLSIVQDAFKFGWGKIEGEITHSLFAYIGIKRLRNMLDEIEGKGNKYVNLAELYSFTIRNNLQRENSEIIHNYYELLPKLNEYTKSLDKVTK